MMTTPRTASFDDFRVGQWVAWIRLDRVYGGRVTAATGHEIIVASGDGLTLTRENAVDSEALLILRDAPTPPVTVRREDYDALVALIDRQPFDGWMNVSVWTAAARALIDHADLGDTA